MPPPSDRLFWPAAALFTAIILGMLFYGGAFTAEFSGAADEPAHFVTSLMVRDYISLWPLPAPRPWATQYYIHYPKVAFGHWPPGYYLLQSAWWLLFPIGRASAIALNAVLASGAALLFYCLARRIRRGWPAIAATVLLLLAPVTQQALAQTMADLPCLLCAMLVLWSVVRLLEQPSGRFLTAVCIAIAVALLMKGTGVALVPGILLAGVVSGIWRRFRISPVLIAGIAAPCVILAGILLFSQNRTAATSSWAGWAGLNMSLPWTIAILPLLTGWGLVFLATAGGVIGCVRRQPAVLAAAAMLTGFLVTSYFVRAIREPRLWIASLPLVLLLALAVYGWSEQRHRWAPLVVSAIALVPFPFQFYRQHPLGFAALTKQISLPERMLVSSPAGWSEGCWIAIVAQGERRPSSTIFRATKMLVHTNWNVSVYEYLASSTAEIEQKLDESVVNAVVLHNAATDKPLPHHELLSRAMRESSSWRQCGEAGEVLAYCRTRPPRFPPKPVRIDLRQHTGETIEEPVTSLP